MNNEQLNTNINNILVASSCVIGALQYWYIIGGNGPRHAKDNIKFGFCLKKPFEFQIKCH